MQKYRMNPKELNTPNNSVQMTTVPATNTSNQYSKAADTSTEILRFIDTTL